jgi:hypothetical protein
MRTEDAVALKFLADEMKILSQIILVGLAPAIVFLMEKIMAAVNQTKAAGSFWGDFFANAKVSDLPKAFSSWLGNAVGAGENPNRPDFKEARERVVTAWMHAAGLSRDELETLTDATADQIKGLIDKQKSIEEINAFPDFTDMMDEKKKTKAPRVRDSGDSLVRVGNFLGSTRDVLERIGERQVELLRQIASNTRPDSSQGMENDIEFTSE